METLHVVLIDKHPLARAGLGQLLADNFPLVQVTELTSVNSLRNKHCVITPDIIVFGLTDSTNRHGADLNHFGVIHGIRDARAYYPQAKLIVYDHKLNPALIRMYLSQGVAGYVEKESEASEVVLCVRIVLAGKRYVNNETLIRMLKEKRPNPAKEIIEKGTSLTRRQYEIACHLASGMSVKWIAGILNVRSSTVSTVKAVIYHRLGVKTQNELRSVLSENVQPLLLSQNV